MAKKYIVLDTETTGLEVKAGHRVIEIGAVLLNNRKKSDEYFHTYLNPMRLIDEEATQVHGITNQDLNDQPLFEDIAEEFIEFVDGATLVIHNAQFDVGFLNNELKLTSSIMPNLEEICTIEDSLQMAKDMFPGQRNSLDALIKRFNIKGYDRELHGGLKDANILADIYLHLTGGQSKFEFITNGNSDNSKKIKNTDVDNQLLKSIKKVITTKTDINAHETKLSEMEKKNKNEAIWRKF
ncbi:MAG: DNA polymerase III subunit epsilon [Gammaproteobacteria bacterium]|nr:DNA polymerase III subunit epsilon [Gammaproteobacteria bacterium]